MGEVNIVTETPVKRAKRPRAGSMIKRGPCGLLNPAKKGDARREDGTTINSLPRKT